MLADLKVAVLALESQRTAICRVLLDAVWLGELALCCYVYAAL